MAIRNNLTTAGYASNRFVGNVSRKNGWSCWSRVELRAPKAGGVRFNVIESAVRELILSVGRDSVGF